MTSERVAQSGILQDNAVRAMLIPLLPEGQQSAEFLEANLRSPQLQQSMDALSHALSSDNFASIMTNLQIDPMPGTARLV